MGTHQSKSIFKDDANVNFMIGWEQNEVEPSLLMIFSHEWPRYLTLVL